MKCWLHGPWAYYGPHYVLSVAYECWDYDSSQEWAQTCEYNQSYGHLCTTSISSMEESTTYTNRPTITMHATNLLFWYLYGFGPNSPNPS